MNNKDRLLLVPAIAAFAMLAAILIALLVTSPRVALLRSLVAAPRASLATPRSGPAVYSGRLHSATERLTPRNARVAAYWWWVVQRKSKEGCGSSPPSVCTEFVTEKLLLKADGTQALTDAVADYHGVSLLADGRDEWESRRIIDLGSASIFSTDVIPQSLARCAGHRREYQERSIAEGAEVEMLACFDKGELRACDGPVGAILASPRVSVHMTRRASHAHDPIRAVALVSAIVLLGLAIHASRLRAQRHALEPRPGGPA
ncbi:MAG: hypothetical protein HY898_09580 [Deltaproteobacteria bacterium]|nr:hypothetical protein [Deltaproteobacteria bacterium]